MCRILAEEFATALFDGYRKFLQPKYEILGGKTDEEIRKEVEESGIMDPTLQYGRDDMR